MSAMAWGWLCAAVLVGLSLVVTCAVLRGGWDRGAERVQLPADPPDEVWWSDDNGLTWERKK